MAHDRKLIFCGIALTKARPNKHDLDVMAEIGGELDKVLIASGYLKNAPFKWVGLSLRYGLKYEDVPHYQGIDKKDGEIALAIELDTHDLIKADREELKRLFEAAALRALIHAGHKYKLPTAALDERLEKLQGAG